MTCGEQPHLTASTTGRKARPGGWVFRLRLEWTIGYFSDIHRAAIAFLFSFLAGGVILNVIKEELPDERESRYWSFVLGAGIYTLILLISTQ
jgi:hypothetical protein